MKLAIFSPVAEGDLIRELDSFESFAEIPNVSAGELTQLIHAISPEAVSATEWKWRKSWKIGPRVIHDSMWFYIEQGNGTGWLGDPQQTFRFESGDLILIPRDLEHCVLQSQEVEAHVFAVHFNLRVFGAIDLFTLLGMPPIVRGNRYSIYAMASHRLAREFAIKAPGWQAVMNADVLATLLNLIRTESAQLKPYLNLSCLSEVPRLLPVFQHIDANLHRPEFAVGEMASKAHLSEVQFRKIFHRITGISPLRFVQRRRIELACNLLHTTTDSISIIAEACGFSDATFFHRVFRAWVGRTPREYRMTEEP